MCSSSLNLLAGNHKIAAILCVLRLWLCVVRVASAAAVLLLLFNGFMYVMFFRRPFCHGGGSGVVLVVVKAKAKEDQVQGSGRRSSKISREIERGGELGVEVFALSLFVEVVVVVVVVIFLLLGVSSVLIHLLTVVAATFLSPTLRLLMWLICHCGEDEASDQFGLGLQRFDSG